ncbi:MAG: hypothetical protein CVV27_11655 [Candidatus Melainabacteria bacterium HGW-Melainabacteria-1]|nr:MAG: hypothetical protein CVV27_11655 [Candidatus Melainabacteria bacterium HGW-Melainabacteria-1]
MPNLTRLSNEDYMAVTRAMDANRNNRIDKTEANVTWQAHNQIGNSNGVAGTRETAEALVKGDVFVSSLPQEAADKVANYFSKRNENFNKPVAEWVSDAWISKEDFDFEPEARRAIDSNGDNRVSSKEFAAALVSGSLTIGTARQVSQNPFNSKPSSPSHGSDPFSKPAQGHDPFAKPAQGHDPFSKPALPPGTKPAQGHDPYQKPAQQPVQQYPDSGAYLQIEMVRTMRSDFEKSQVLSQLAQKNNLSPREQVMLAEASSQLSDYSKGQVLQQMAANRSMHEDGLVKVAKMAREVSDFNRGQIVTALVNNHKLPPQAQQSVIITIGTLNGDFGKTQHFSSLLQSQQLHPENKELLLRTVQEKVSSDFSKRQIMDQMFK